MAISLCNTAFNPTQNIYAQLVAPVLLLLSILLFWSAVISAKGQIFDFLGSNSAPSKVINSGIFGRIRHPFYSSYIISWLGCALSTTNITAIIIFIVAVTIYVISARREERLMLGSELSDEYINYQKNTGMFIPKFLIFKS